MIEIFKNKMFKYRFNQGINYLFNSLDFGTPLKWLYIYGHHRGGTTYTLNEYLKVSKRGTGDWMMFEFANSFSASERRKRQKLNISKLKKNFRKNLLTNAQIGGGQYYDIVIKQAVGTQKLNDVQSELNFFSEIFKSPPDKKLFLYREPYGWWSSAKLKFNHDNQSMIKYYKKAIESFYINGGLPLEYGDEIYNYLKEQDEFKKVEINMFMPKQINIDNDAKILEAAYNDFKEHVGK